ncbi:MAG TPA: ATP-binding protein [Myxococcales bacterium]|nr:ATP-binding protein [Myxococcales bacterium]
MKHEFVPHRAPSPLPTYPEELESAQRQALRTACFLAAALLVAFSALDRAVTPEHWQTLLLVRVAAAFVLLLLGRRLGQPGIRALWSAAAAAFVSAVTLEAGIFATGGVRSAYLYAVLLIVAGVSILLPLRPRQALILHAEMLGITVLPLLFVVRGREDALELGTRASFLLCASVLGVAGAAIQDRLRRREHQARVEFARHVGLVNLGTLAGGLAHELANPLTSVSLEIEAADALLRPGEHTRHMHNALQGLSRMRSILEAMRRGARFSDGDQREVDLLLEIEVALVLLQGRLKHRVELVRDYGEVPPVRCQPTLLGQVLVNLVVNAVDALRDRPDARLCLRTRRLDGHALIEVQDNGPGVPAGLRQRIFEPFFTTKGEGGNGLGLWISAEIARLHGGRLSYSEAPEGGSIFRLSLPLPPPATLRD